MLKIGHRGAAGYEPENTIRSFQRAVDDGAHIELDIRCTKDQRLLVMHDATVTRTTNGDGRVSHLTYNDIRALRTKDKSQEIPFLEDVLDGFPSVLIFIEAKDIEAVKPLASLLASRADGDRIIIISYQETMRLVRTLLPTFQTALSFMLPFVPSLWLQKIVIPTAKELGVQWVNLNHYMASRSLVQALHKEHVKVNVWTVDRPPRIERMKEIGVDGIISNYPDRL